MSERKLDEIETMFKKTSKPKLEVNEITPINKISVIVDNTIQGKRAFETAINLTKKLELSLDVIVTDDLYESFSILMENNTLRINELSEMIKNEIKESGIYAKQNLVLSGKIEKAIKIYSEEAEEGQKLSDRIINKLTEMDSDIVIVGAPLFKKTDSEAPEYFGKYLRKLLRERRIHSNFLLITDTSTPDINDSILAMVSFEQQPGSILALTKRALSLSTKQTNISLVGFIEDKVIETVARVETPEEEEVDQEGYSPLDLEGAGTKLTTKLQDTLESIKISEEIEYNEFKTYIQKGPLATSVKTALELYQPGIVLVRSVGEISENLDPIAEQKTRIILGSGIPCLIVWD